MENKHLGPLMISIDGFELTEEDKEILEHPAVCGVIIFSRNYHSIEQITELNYKIKNLKAKNHKNSNSLLISIDHEGGPVQRIKQPLTVIPAMSELGKLYEYSSAEAIDLATNIGWVLASELLSLGFDFSFTPMVDLNISDNKIIKLRALHKKADIVSNLALALKAGLDSAGMAAVGKHFPGHGGVLEDSHFQTPIDGRSFKEINHHDLEPYKVLIKHGLEAIMTSHIIYNNIDNHVVTFSKFWLQDILRDKLNFQGLIVSDDLNMAGAKICSSEDHEPYTNLVNAALTSGCELLLLCNNRKAVIEVLDNWSDTLWQSSNDYSARLNAMRARLHDRLSLEDLRKQQLWQSTVNNIEKLAG